MFKLALLTVLLGITYAAPSGVYGGHGYSATSNVNDANGLRQAQVNNVAEYIGTGIGTADYEGVPGTHVRKTGYGAHHGHAAGYGTLGYNGAYGAQGYNGAYGAHGYNGAYGAHGHAAGYGTHGYNAGYGVHGHAAGYGTHGHAAGYGTHGYAAGYQPHSHRYSVIH